MTDRYLARMAARTHRWFWLFAVLPPLTSLAADDRPDTLAAAGGNPLALNAMAFLAFFWKLFFVLALITLVVRLFRGLPKKRSGSIAELGEDPYLMAYLAGGPRRVVGTALASLVHQGALRVNAVTRELIPEETLPANRPKIERDVRALFRTTRHVSDKARFQRWMQGELGFALTLMHKRLQQAGLLGRPPVQVLALIPLWIGFALLFGIGAIRLINGIGAGRPVGFLVISMVVTGLSAYGLLRGLGKERATPNGERLLQECKSRLGRGGDDRLWTVSLLGLTDFGSGQMADLGYVVQELPPGNLFGGSSQKSGSGNSSGNGGCGGAGCGGGGCGGGGCGG